MNIHQMRRVDLICGSMLCLLLQIFDSVRSLFLRFIIMRSSTETKDFQRILVTKYLGMGSIIMASPMVRALRKRYPASRVDLLTFDGNAELARQLGLFDTVISLRTSSLIAFTGDFLSVIANIIRTRYEIVFDLEFFARFSTIVSYLSGARFRVGYYLPRIWRGQFLTHQIHFNMFRHVTEIISAQLQPFNVPVNDFSLQAPVVQMKSVSRVRDLLTELGWQEGKELIIVNPNASDLCEERKWPGENFIELLSGLAVDHPKYFIVLIGSDAEREYVESLRLQIEYDLHSRVVSLAGDLSIKELVALLSLCRLLITNDSGPLHIAAALNIPTAAFFGPESPQIYGPVGGKSLVFYEGIYCSPCLNVYNAKTAMCNGNNICMKAISCRYVREKLEESGFLR